jgi:Tfp pilus assembly protein PilN
MKNYQINLLPKKKPSLIDKIVYFSLHYLRYVVVITQIVVIVVFFYRFKVDQEIIDLKESTDQKEEIIKLTLPIVTEAQTIDERMNQIKQILEKQARLTTNLDYIFSIFPAQITLTSLDFNESKIKLMGTTSNPPMVKLFVEKLKSDKKFKQVAINQINKKGFIFEFSITILI